MRVPETTHSGNLNRTKVPATGREGSERLSGKTNNPDSVMTDAKVLKKAPEAVKQAVPVLLGSKVGLKDKNNGNSKLAGITDCCCCEDK